MRTKAAAAKILFDHGWSRQEIEAVLGKWDDPLETRELREPPQDRMTRKKTSR